MVNGREARRRGASKENFVIGFYYYEQRFFFRMLFNIASNCLLENLKQPNPKKVSNEAAKWLLMTMTVMWSTSIPDAIKPK